MSYLGELHELLEKSSPPPLLSPLRWARFRQSDHMWVTNGSVVSTFSFVLSLLFGTGKQVANVVVVI